MYILAEICNNPEVLRVIYFMNIIFDMIFTILPIGLIVILMIDFTKAVIASKEEEQTKSVKLVGKRIMYAILTFMVPYFVRLVIIFLDEVEVISDGRIVFAYDDCLSNANSKQIEYFQKIEDEEERREKEKREEEIKNNAASGGTSGGSSGSASSAWNGHAKVSKTYQEAAEDMLNLAKGEIGHVGGNKYSGRGDSVAWCAYFTIWNLENTKVAGVGSILDIIQEEGNVTSRGYAGGTMPNFYHSKNLEFHYSKHYGGNYTPKKGDIIYFKDDTWDEEIDGTGDHVGLVDYVSNGQVYTVEGNVGGQGSANNHVGTGQYALDSSYIMGYGSWYNNSSYSYNNYTNRTDELY